ncbi:hypothetical protein PIB30_055209 [Stylosanthes scabra]|uniref:tRNA synthetases class I catalytic domain-containing protein n=1 Tax=Stylosanthes scabra TaxID=79078 RepID=A0ABU6RJP9_9FABA|nr:hypothetical protein [Stylosanthes scabra]
MGTLSLSLSLLKFYKPSSSIPRSTRPIFFRTIKKLRSSSSFTCFSNSVGQSQPLTAHRNIALKSEGQNPKGPSPELWLHNTMSKKRELLKPKVESKVGMYVCGVTAYDLSHIGHARVYVNFDLLFRYLKHLGYEVSYVRNFTDVDDKIIARANELGEDPISLSQRYCEEFRQDMITLNCLTPSVEPKVSEHMPQIIDMIEKILNNGYAYVVDGDVYYSVEKFPEYGKLSGRDLEDNRAGERVAVDSRKKHPADFALWKVYIGYE